MTNVKGIIARLAPVVAAYYVGVLMRGSYDRWKYDALLQQCDDQRRAALAEAVRARTALRAGGEES